MQSNLVNNFIACSSETMISFLSVYAQEMFFFSNFPTPGKLNELRRLLSLCSCLSKGLSISGLTRILHNVDLKQYSTSK